MKVIYKRKRFWISILLGCILLFIVFKKADFPHLISNLKDLNFFWVLISLLCSVGSYVCIAAVLKTLLEATGNKLKDVEIFNVAFVSTVANYVMALAGVSGLAVKIYLLAKRKIPPSQTLSISIVHGFFTNTIAIFFVTTGFFFFYGHFNWHSDNLSKSLPLICFVLLILISALALFILHSGFRRDCWKFVRRVLCFLAKRFSSSTRFLDSLNATFNNFDSSMSLMVKNLPRLAKASFYALADWMLMFWCFQTSFLAANYHVKVQILIIGFCVGLFISLVSIIPGSVGIMEGSMVSVFYFLGLDYEKSLVAIMVYRLFYYFLPTIVGIILFGHDLSSTSEVSSVTETG